MRAVELRGVSRRILYGCTAAVALYSALIDFLSPYPRSPVWSVRAVLLLIGGVALVEGCVSLTGELRNDRAALVGAAIVLAGLVIPLVAIQTGIVRPGGTGIPVGRVSSQLVAIQPTAFEQINIRFIAPWLFLLQPCLATASLCLSSRFAQRKKLHKSSSQPFRNTES